LSKEDFQQAVEKELTGKISEPWEIVYFKLYQSQIPVIDQALETAALMLGSERSRGYCLEMICADFLAGANLDDVEHTPPRWLALPILRRNVEPRNPPSALPEPWRNRLRSESRYALFDLP
jgi:hypothetical protein